MSYFSLYRPIPLGGNVRGNCPDTLLTMFTGACNSSFCAKCSHVGCLNGYACEPSLQIPSGNVHTVMEPWQCGIFQMNFQITLLRKRFLRYRRPLNPNTSSFLLSLSSIFTILEHSTHHSVQMFPMLGVSGNVYFYGALPVW